jgi:hypothetical protein
MGARCCVNDESDGTAIRKITPL